MLEKAGLVSKRRSGKEKVVHLVPTALKRAEAHLREYERLWAARLDGLESLLDNDN